jgi:hypothetical protein
MTFASRGPASAPGLADPGFAQSTRAGTRKHAKAIERPMAHRADGGLPVDALAVPSPEPRTSRCPEPRLSARPNCLG